MMIKTQGNPSTSLLLHPASLATFSYLATSAGIILRMFMREESPIAKAFEGCANQTCIASADACRVA